MSSVRIREHSKKENYPYLHQCPSVPPRAAKQDAHVMPLQQQLVAPFQFNSRRTPIDWRLLHGIDVSKMVSNKDSFTCYQRGFVTRCSCWSRTIITACQANARDEPIAPAWPQMSHLANNTYRKQRLAIKSLVSDQQAATQLVLALHSQHRPMFTYC